MPIDSTQANGEAFGFESWFNMGLGDKPDGVLWVPEGEGLLGPCGERRSFLISLTGGLCRGLGVFFGRCVILGVGLSGVFGLPLRSFSGGVLGLRRAGEPWWVIRLARRS